MTCVRIQGMSETQRAGEQCRWGDNQASAWSQSSLPVFVCCHSLFLTNWSGSLKTERYYQCWWVCVTYECEDTRHSVCGLRATFRSCFSSSTLFRQGLFCSSHTSTPGSLARGFLDDYPVSTSHLAAAVPGLQVCATMSVSLHGSQVLEPCIGYFFCCSDKISWTKAICRNEGEF